MRIVPLIVLFGCGFSASTKVREAVTDTGATVQDDDSSAPTDSGSADSGSADRDPSDVDDDGDGYTENQGDCDDQDAETHPGAADDCDGVDNDCDGLPDDDAAAEDLYEPNDETDYALGSLDDDPEHTMTAILHNDEDVDRFGFSFSDTWQEFALRVALSGVPDGATYRIELVDTDSGETVDAVSGDTDLVIELEDSFGSDDDGTFRVVVRSMGGADCSQQYLLTIALDESWWPMATTPTRTPETRESER